MKIDKDVIERAYAYNLNIDEIVFLYNLHFEMN